MTAFSPSQSIVNAYQNAYASSAPNAESGWFPPKGEVDIILRDVTTRSFKKKIKGTNAEVACSLITFNFQMIQDPDSPSAPRSFDDSAFVLADNPADPGIDDTLRKQLERDLSRLKGHMNALFNRETTMADFVNLPTVRNVAVRAESDWFTYVQNGATKGPFKRLFLRAHLGRPS